MGRAEGTERTKKQVMYERVEEEVRTGVYIIRGNEER